MEQNRIKAIRAQGERRRHEHRQEGAAAVSHMLDRGETPTAIAELAGVKVSEVRAVLKSAGAEPDAAPNARGAPSAARGTARSAHRGAANRTGSALGDATNPIGVGGTA